MVTNLLNVYVIFETEAIPNPNTICRRRGRSNIRSKYM